MTAQPQIAELPPHSREPLVDSPTAGWLLDRKRVMDGSEFVQELCERLVAEGVPLARMNCAVPAAHPQVYAHAFIWVRGKGVETTERAHGTTNTPEYLQSPIPLIADGVEAIRRRLEGPETQFDFPVLHDYKALGMTDYVIMALRFGLERVSFISWTTDRPGGFVLRELELLWSLLPLIELRLEIYSAYRMSENLLTTYLGHNAARKVLAGGVRRGVGQHINAAIWYSDLRGSTAMADRLSPHQLISTLDDYFECMTRAVHEHGGEVLKFIGDGMLAIFEMQDEREMRPTTQALNAALMALQGLEELSGRREEFALPALRCGIALHVGEVMYGNIGGSDRLDFTVIGAAVNEVARVESMCSRLGRPLMTTARFQSLANDARLDSVGFHVLRGVREPQELFAISPYAIPGGRMTA